MGSFQIRIEGQAIDLKPDRTITLNRYNPIFDFDVIQGSKVLDFVVPFSPKNNKFFNWYYKPQAAFPTEDLYCEQYADGELIERGYITLREVGNDGYKVMYSQNLGEIFGDYQKVLLPQIDFGTAPVPGGFTAAANHLTDAYCLPTVQNPGFYGTAPPVGFTGYMNEYTSGAYTVTAPKVPMVYLRWLLEQIEDLCNFTITGQFIDDLTMKRLVLYNTFAVEPTDTVIEFRNHLPELTIPDLLKELRKLFNLALFFDVRSRTLTMHYVDNLLQQATTLNWSQKFGEVAARSPELATRLELDWEVDSNDGRMKVKPLDYEKYNTDGTELLFPVKTRFSTTDVTETGLPLVEQPGITTVNNQRNAKFGPRLLLWHGMVGGIPFASNYYGTTRLAWHGTNNLVDAHWRQFETFRGRTSRRILAGNLTATDIAKIDMHQRAGETMCVHIQGRDYIIGNQRINLPLKGATELELWMK
ncbi:hypothetical protein P1X15_07065 [Runella sp. MFBS21]|uniref:hypothetical protein n=1 Tax=Runella sp. MFBS21 TaxID=3034018 RepID=UPI0023F6ADC2|nr:hypothetical protein [Runella sp. MFBS21]MDF7817346.1 hypothetical protein [Runella sp. MFBS21]